MPFGSITAQTKVYEPRSPGVYSLQGVTFDQPADEFRLRGSTKGGSNRTATITRVVQKDVVVGSDTQRLGMTVSLQIQTPSNPAFTAAMADSAAQDISEFLTAQTVSRLLQGEI